MAGRHNLRLATLLVLGACFAVPGVAYAATPHSGFSTTTELCGSCHVPHSAATGTKIMRSEQTVLCLTCHDGRGSSLNIAADFAPGTDTRYSHDVSDAARGLSGGSTSCDGCHNPHDALAGARYVDPDARSQPMPTPIESVVASDGSVYVLVGSEHDGVAPVISAESIDASTTTPAAPKVSWTTNEGASSWIDWGTTVSYELGNASSGTPFGNGTYTASHAVTLSGLTLGTTYHYRIRTADALGNVTLGADRTYKPTTPPPAPVISNVTTQTGPGWGPIPVPLGCSTVVSSDAHAVEYQFEVVGVGSSAWQSSTSWSASLYDGAYTVRVRARDAVDIVPVGAWSTTDAFVVENAPMPEEGPAFVEPQVAERVLASLGVVAVPSPAEETTVTIGQDAYSVDTDLLVLRHQNTSGTLATATVAAAWESQSAEASRPVPASPGSSVALGSYFKASSVNGDYFRTALAGTDRRWDWQVVKFDLGSQAATATSELSMLWRGHGVPTAGYHTALYVWDLPTGSWREITHTEMPVDRNVGWTTQSVSSNLCIRCHDTTLPEGVVMPSGVTTISTAWNATGDRHGAGVGTGFGGTLKAPYSRGQDGVACAACHDKHGSGSIYHFPSKVNGTAVPAITTGAAGSLCASCHQGALSSWHQACYACHAEPHTGAPDITDRLPTASSDCFECHGHGKSWTHVDGCLACHGIAELEALNAGGHAPWTYSHTF